MPHGNSRDVDTISPMSIAGETHSHHANVVNNSDIVSYGQIPVEFYIMVEAKALFHKCIIML